MEITYNYLRVDDLNKIQSSGDTKLVAKGIREDGSVIVGKRSVSGRILAWIKGKLGQRDEAAEQLVKVFCSQLNAIGSHGDSALKRSGINSQSRSIKLNQARAALHTLKNHGINPKRSETAIYALATQNIRKVHANEVDDISCHLNETPETKRFLDEALSNLKIKHGALSEPQELKLRTLISWLAADRFIELSLENPGISPTSLRQQALVEVSSHIEHDSEPSIQGLLKLFGKKPEGVPHLFKGLSERVPDDQILNLAWITHIADIKGPEGMGPLFHFMIDRIAEREGSLPNLFSPEDLWAHCFEEHPPKLDRHSWTTAFERREREWIIEQLPTQLTNTEAKYQMAISQFGQLLQYLGMSGKESIRTICNQSNPNFRASSTHMKFPVKLTDESWAEKPMRECKKIAANDIKRLYSNPQLVSSLKIEMTDGSHIAIELDNRQKMSADEEKAFKNSDLDHHPIINDALETQLRNLCVSEEQVKGIFSGISASSRTALIPISIAFAPYAKAAGLIPPGSEHSSCEISLKRIGDDVLLTLKPIGVDWLNTSLEYKISPNGGGVLTRYESHTDLG